MFLCLPEAAALILSVLLRISNVLSQIAALLVFWSNIWHFELWPRDGFKVMGKKMTKMMHE